MKKIIVFSILMGLISFNSYADDPRFTRVLEFELMYECLGTSKFREKKIKICACALARTQENGVWPDYDHDGDYHEDEDKFVTSFIENIRYFKERQDECENI